jgi:hypothetical protein
MKVERFAMAWRERRGVAGFLRAKYFALAWFQNYMKMVTIAFENETTN